MIIFKNITNTWSTFNNYSILSFCKREKYLDTMEIFISDPFTKIQDNFYHRYIRPYLRFFYSKTDHL